MAAKSNFKNMVICLTLVCLVCSAILAAVYSVTYEPIEAAKKAAVTESIGKVLPEGGCIGEEKIASLGGKEYSYYEQTSGEEVCAYAVKSATVGFGGPLVLMVGVLPDGTVYNVSVLDANNETPGLGAKCKTDQGFLSQWKGFGAGKVLKVKQDGGDVDAITASTITSRAFTLAVANAVELVKTINQGGQCNE